MKPCSVCRHKRRAEIDRMLVAGCSYRTITTLFSDLSPQALGRHKRAHIPELLRKAAQDREAEDLQEAKDLARQCARYLRKANEMLGAADSWLRDPDTGEYNLDPRSTEVSVIYSQLIGGKEVRKKAPLSELLAKLEQGRPVVVHNTTWRVSDPRDLLLKAIDRGARVVELMGRLSGELEVLPDLELVVRLVVEALRPHPASLRQVLEGLREAKVPVQMISQN